MYQLANMMLSPVEMLLDEINRNNDKSYTVNDLEFRNLQSMIPTTPEKVTVNGKEYTVTRNTTIEAKAKDAEVADDWVTLAYQRISLDKLFSECDPELLEVDIVTDGKLQLGDLWREVIRKYKVRMDAEGFGALVNNDILRIRATDDNVAYTGSVNIKVAPSLFSRVFNRQLDGFEKPEDPGYPTLDNGNFSKGPSGLDGWSITGQSINNFYVEDNELVSKGLYTQWTPCIAKAVEQEHKHQHWLKGQVVSFEINVESKTFQFPQFDVNGRNPIVTEVGPTGGKWVKKDITLTRDCLYWAFACWDGYTKYRIRNVSVSAPK